MTVQVEFSTQTTAIHHAKKMDLLVRRGDEGDTGYEYCRSGLIFSARLDDFCSGLNRPWECDPALAGTSVHAPGMLLGEMEKWGWGSDPTSGRL